jgi:tetratricopeptide (TPR) repeat protein
MEQFNKSENLKEDTHQWQFYADRECYAKAIKTQPELPIAYVNLGTLYAQIGWLPEAIALYEKALRLEPNFADVYRSLARAWDQLGRLEKAADVWYELLTIEPEVSGVQELLTLGDRLKEQGKIEDAISCYSRVIQFDPNMAVAYRNLGNSQAKIGQLEKAIASYSQGIDLAADSETYYKLAQIFAKLGRLDQAIVAYRHAIELTPDVSYIHNSLGETLEQRAELNLAQAITAYRHAINLNPDNLQAYRSFLTIQPYNWEVWWEFGKTLVKLDRWEEAISCYRQAIQIEPTVALIHYQLGEILEKQGSLEKGIASYLIALEIDSSLMSDEDSLGKDIAKLGYLKKFPANDEAFLQITNNLTDADFIQAVFCTYLKRSLDEKAIPEVLKYNSSNTRKQIVANIRASHEFHLIWDFLLHPVSCDREKINWRLGAFFAQQGNWEQAVVAYHQVLAHKPEIALGYYACAENIVLHYKDKKNIYEQILVRAKFFKSLQKQQLSAESYLCLGRFLAERYQWSEAIEAYQKSLSLKAYSSDSEDIYFHLGQAQANLSQSDSAIANFQKALQFNSQAPEIYAKLGLALAQENQLEAAISAFKKALHLKPEFSEVYVYIGEVMLKQNQLDEAIIACEKFVDNQVEKTYPRYQQSLQLPLFHDQCYWVLAQALTLTGRLEEALSYLQELVNQKNPWAYPEAITKLGNILLQQGKQEEASVCFQKVQQLAPPQETYASTREWASQWLPAGYIEIAPSHLFKIISPPKTIDQDIHPCVTSWIHIESPATFVALVPEGRYFQFEDYNTAVITSDNHLLLDASAWQHQQTIPHPILSRKNLPLVNLVVDGTVAVFPLNAGGNYYHYIFDVLPMLGLLELSGIDLDTIDKFLLNVYGFSFYKETLEILGIPQSKILDIQKYPHVKAAKLIVPSQPGVIALPTRASVEFLRSKFIPLTSQSTLHQPKRLYISRCIANHRRIINEDAVVDVLSKLGFVTITGESLSMAEKASLMSGAEVVVGLSGAGLANMVLCKAGTKVIEIFSSNYILSTYYMLSQHLGLDYYYLIGEGIDCPYLRQFIYNIDGYEDTLVNIDSLKSLLKMANIT